MDCELMSDIATFKPLICLLVYFVIISTVSIPTVSYIIIRIARNKLYHLNTRIILVAHGLGIVIHSIDRVILHSYDLYRWLIVLPNTATPCDIFLTSESCFSLRLCLNCGMWFSICTTPTIVLERFIATQKIATYQKDKSCWRWMIIFQMCISSVLLSFLYAETKFGKLVPYCMAAKDRQSASGTPMYTLIAFGSTTIVQTTSILVFRYLMRKVEKIRLAFHQNGVAFNKRYQIEESLRSFKAMSLSVHIMYIFQFSHSFLSFLILNFTPLFSRPMFLFIMEMTSFLPEYAIFFVIAVIYQERKIAKSNMKSLKKNINIQPKAYFEQYKEPWKT